MREDAFQESYDAAETLALLCILELGNEQIAAGKVHPAHEVIEDILRRRGIASRLPHYPVQPDR